MSKVEHDLFVPGRLCLFGEHSDWAGALRAEEPGIAPGACIISGTDQGLTATAAAAGLGRCLPLTINGVEDRGAAPD